MNIKINNLNKLIYLSCELLNIKIPHIYYVSYYNQDVTLYDHNMNVVSYDKRDIPKQHIHYAITVSYALYINIDIFNDITMSRIIVLRQIRKLYQLVQIKLHDMNKETLEDKLTINAWKFAYDLEKRQDKYIAISQNEFDCSAFASYMVFTIFNQCIKYDFKTNEESKYKRYNNIYLSIQERYEQEEIIDLCKKHKIIK